MSAAADIFILNMALTKEQKQKAISDLEDKLSQYKSMVFIDYSKVKSKDIFGLRKKLKAAGCLLKVAKKTLLKIAMAEKKVSFWEEIDKNTPGQLAVVFGFEDEIAPAKIVEQSSRENENIKILGGIFENAFVAQEKVLIFAKIPSRQELLGNLVRSIAAPVSGFVNVLQGNIKGLITVLAKAKT